MGIPGAANRFAPAHRPLDHRAVAEAIRGRPPVPANSAWRAGSSGSRASAPADRGIDGVVAIRADAKGVSLYFSQGPQLPDPKRLLRGSGKQTRYIQVEAASQLAHPDVEALLAATVDQARIPLPAKGKGSLIIKSADAE